MGEGTATAGFIIRLVEAVIFVLRHINLVELFKAIAARVSQDQSSDAQKRAANVAIDIFILLKWAFVAILWISEETSTWAVAATLYLIVMNLFTYFYYHVWCVESLAIEIMTPERTKRRFVNAMLAMAYSDFCFAYLYATPFASDFSWPRNVGQNFAAIQFSLANSLTAAIWGTEPITTAGMTVSSIQLLMTFAFATVVLTQSIPQIHRK